MDDVAAPTRYWCHMCSQIVDPIMEVEIKCPSCQNGFVEEMSGTTRETEEPENDLGSDRSLSLWAPILLGMMNNPRSRRRMRRLRFDDDDEDEDDYEHHDDDRDFRDSFSSRFRHRGDSELDREIESIIRRRRRRSSASILQLLQGIRAGMVNEFDNADPDRDRDRDRESDRDRNRERDRVLLINPFNQTIVLRGASYDSTDNSNLVGSLGDYFIGPGLDLLLQHLAENDPNRYGTPPAKKEDIEALPTVKVKETSQCSVCLDDFVVGTEVKEMPCKHMFHSGCILPWLELHSSCPVCRFQLAADESKVNLDGDGSVSRNVSSSSSQGSGDANGSNEEERRNADANPSPNEGNGNGNGTGRRFSMSWPFNFNSLFGNSNNSTSSSSNSHERSTNE